MPPFIEIVFLTLRVSGIALGLATFLGVPFGALLGLSQFRGRSFIVGLVYTGMGLPPVVVGLAVYLTLSRSGPLSDFNWLFTPTAMITAQMIIALPLIIGISMAAVDGLDPAIRLQLRSLGTSRRQEMIGMLSEARSGVLAGIVAGFGGIISEVGAAILVGGNIEGKTRILSTAIVLETRRGNFGFGLALGGVLLTLAFIVNFLLMRLEARGRWRA
jgi:tungstate transport system permease protein